MKILKLTRKAISITIGRLKISYYKILHGKSFKCLGYASGNFHLSTPKTAKWEFEAKSNVLIKSSRDDYHIGKLTPCYFRLEKESAQISIGDDTRIFGSAITAYEKIQIGKRCLIASDCQIMDCSGHSISADCVEERIQVGEKKLIGKIKPVIIEDDVWLGTRVIILPGVKVGKGSVIAAGSVVNKNIPSYTIAGGNPAKIIRSFR